MQRRLEQWGPAIPPVFPQTVGTGDPAGPASPAWWRKENWSREFAGTGACCLAMAGKQVCLSHLKLARLSHQLTVEARDRPAITSLRLLAVLNVLGQACFFVPNDDKQECLSYKQARVLILQASKSAYPTTMPWSVSTSKRAAYPTAGEPGFSKKTKDLTSQEARVLILQASKSAYPTSKQECLSYKQARVLILQASKSAYPTSKQECLSYKQARVLILQASKSACPTGARPGLTCKCGRRR